MNLWADFENNQLTQPVPVSNTRPRRITEQVIQETVRNWLVRDYIPAYCRALAASRIFRRCYWVDALGGEQRTQTLLPIETLHRQLSQESRPISLYGLLLTAGSSKRKDAVGAKFIAPAITQKGFEAVAPTVPKKGGKFVASTIPKEGGVLRASWLEVAPALLTEIAQSPAICLLNPCGQTLFSSSDLLPLYQRTLPTELLLWLSHRQIAEHFTRALHSPDHATILTALLRTDRWKTLSPTQEDLPQSIATLTDLLIASMQRHFHFPVQRLQFPLLVRSAVVEMMPATLLFATRRQDSLLSMNDAICRYHRQVYEQSHHGLLAEEWFRQQQQGQEARALQQMEEYLLQQGRAQRIRRWPDLRQHVLLNHFGQFMTYDYDALILQLLARNEVRCEWKRKRSSERETEEANETEKLETGEEVAVPGNDDTLLWR